MRAPSKTTGRPRRHSGGRLRQPGKILDLFAGAGGWEEGLGTLALRALGIETEPWACQTARAAGHKRIQADVSELDPQAFSPVWGLIGSPPCQAYSAAGKGLGRADKPLVVACAHELAAGNDSRRAWREGCRDPRSLLTVEPLRYAIALRPRWVALEQVPAVLELWTLFAALLVNHGYHTAAGVLSAECYGVPQTRKRAFLIASLDGPVKLPPATHRSYNARRQHTPEDEQALLPWVSMAEALGWTPADRVGFPRRTDTPSNNANAEDDGYRERDRRAACKPAKTLTQKTRSWTRNTEQEWPALRPAPTLVTSRRSKDGALVGRQLPPGEGQERGGWAWRNGNQPNAAIRSTTAPAPTVHFGHRANKVEWVPDDSATPRHQTQGRSKRRRAPRTHEKTPGWAAARPATTVACDPRVHPPGHKENASDPPGRYQQRRGANAVRVTVSQAAVLQGFPADYPWRGSRTRQFEQVGNAVPPPLARRVLEQALQPMHQGSTCIPSRGRA